MTWLYFLGPLTKTFGRSCCLAETLTQFGPCFFLKIWKAAQRPVVPLRRSREEGQPSLNPLKPTSWRKQNGSFLSKRWQDHPFCRTPWFNNSMLLMQVVGGLLASWKMKRTAPLSLLCVIPSSTTRYLLHFSRKNCEITKLWGADSQWRTGVHGSEGDWYVLLQFHWGKNRWNQETYRTYFVPCPSIWEARKCKLIIFEVREWHSKGLWSKNQPLR